MASEMIVILDYDGKHAISAANKLRSDSVYCEILPHDVPFSEIAARDPKGIILIGGSDDAFMQNAPRVPEQVLEMGIPVLGIGYGARGLLNRFGARLVDSVLDKQTQQVLFDDSPLFSGLSLIERYFERIDQIEYPPEFSVIAKSGEGIPVAFSMKDRPIFGMQFFAEQNDPDGLRIMSNFSRGICGCAPEWNVETFVERQVAAIRASVEGEALIAVSGGIDSAVAAMLMHRAIGKRLHCVHIDTGLLRKDETDVVIGILSDRFGLDLIHIDASERFLRRLRGVSNPEDKHLGITEELVSAFVDAAAGFDEVDCLVQGTIYSDVLARLDIDEAYSIARQTGELVRERTNIRKIIEPVRMLFKEEVRKVGEFFGLPPELVHRQPFPVTGLALRCLGEVSAHKLRLLRESDAIFQEEIVQSGHDKRIWQSFCVLTDIRSHSVRGSLDELEYTVALRAVNRHSSGVINAYRMPYDLLERVVSRITSEVPGINRVVYDMTGKPPAMVEWE